MANFLVPRHRLMYVMLGATSTSAPNLSNPLLERIVGLAPLDLLAREQLVDPVFGAGPDIVGMHDRVVDRAGVAVPQPIILLQPGKDLAAFYQPFLSGQLAKVVRRLACLGFDVVQIRLKLSFVLSDFSDIVLPPIPWLMQVAFSPSLFL